MERGVNCWRFHYICVCDRETVMFDVAMTILATFWHLATVNMAIFGKSKTHYSSWNVSKPLLSVAPCCLHSSSCCWKRRALSGQNVWLEPARSRFGCFAGGSTLHHPKAYFSIDVLMKNNILRAAYKSYNHRCFTRELFCRGS